MTIIIESLLGDIIPFPPVDTSIDDEILDKSGEAPRREGAGPVVIPIIEPVDISHDIYKDRPIDVVSEIMKYFT